MNRLTRPSTLAAFVAAVVTACASGGTASTTSVPTTQSVEISGSSVTSSRMGTGSGVSMQTSRVDNGESTVLATPPDSVWPALIQAYNAVGIQPNTAVSVEGHVALVNGRVRRQLGKTYLSQYLSCGADAMGVPHADAFDVVLNVDSRIMPAGVAGTTLITRVTADAHSPAASGVTVSCGSTGVLEARIASEARKRIGQTRG